MKVVKQGKPWSKKVICTGAGNGGGGCKSTLEVFREDLFTTSHQSYSDDMPDHYITVQCVSCDVKTDIGGVPDQVRPSTSKRKPSGPLVQHGEID